MSQYKPPQQLLAQNGIERLRTPRRCVGCGCMTVLKSRKPGPVECFECSVREKKATSPRPFRLATLATLLLLCAGCASGPSKMNVDVRIAGQELKVSVMR